MCDCIEKFNEQLLSSGHAGGENTRVAVSIHLDMNSGKTDSRPTLVTEKIVKKGPKAVVIWPAYCPICGEKYKQED